MARSKSNKADLEKLVDELMKDEPNRQLVKQLTNSLGLPYSMDPMTQINTVLQSMDSVYVRDSRRQDLEK